MTGAERRRRLRLLRRDRDRPGPRRLPARRARTPRNDAGLHQLGGTGAGDFVSVARSPSRWGRWREAPDGRGQLPQLLGGLPRPSQRTCVDQNSLSTPHPSGFARHLPASAEKGRRGDRLQLSISRNAAGTSLFTRRSSEGGGTGDAGIAGARRRLRRRRIAASARRGAHATVAASSCRSRGSTTAWPRVSPSSRATPTPTSPTILTTPSIS